MTILDISCTAPETEQAAHTAHLRVEGRRVGGVPVMSLEGELDTWTATCPEWKSAVANVCARSGAAAGMVVLDLGHLYFMDSTGLTALEELAAVLASGGKRLVLAGVRPRIRELFRYACADIAPEYPSVEDALAAA